MLGATRIVDKLGIKTLEIQKKVNGYWQAAYTLKNQYQYNTGTFVLDLLYYGTPGAEYRSYVEFYVEDDGGSETKLIVSSFVFCAEKKDSNPPGGLGQMPQYNK